MMAKNGDDRQVAFQNVLLKKVKIGVKHYVSESILDDMHLEVVTDVASQHLVAALRAYLWASKTHEELDEVTYVPADWWQSFRARWFPAWWLLKHPVKKYLVQKRVTHMHICPHLSIRNKQGGDAMHFGFLAENPCASRG